MFNKLKTKFSKLIKSRKLNVFGLFFLLSFCFWGLTKLSRNYTETILFDIVYENVPEEHHINLDSTKKVNVTVNAYGFNLLRYAFYKPRLEIDFSTDVAINNKTYVWNAQQNAPKINSKFKNSVDVISIQPDTLRFPFQTLTVKKVPVIPKVSVDFASGYDMLSSYEVVPDSIKLIGSKKWLTKINEVSTEKLELKNVKSNIDNSVAIEIDKTLKHVKLSQDKVTIKGEVEKFTEGTFNVPVTITNLPADVNINYFPKTIPVAYNISLNDYKSVKASDFRIECNYKDVNNTEKTFLIPQLITVPDLVKSARLKQKKVEFILIQ